MPDRYLLSARGAVTRPQTIDELRAAILSGKVRATDRVRHEQTHSVHAISELIPEAAQLELQRTAAPISYRMRRVEPSAQPATRAVSTAAAARPVPPPATQARRKGRTQGGESAPWWKPTLAMVVIILSGIALWFELRPEQPLAPPPHFLDGNTWFVAGNANAIELRNMQLSFVDQHIEITVDGEVKKVQYRFVSSAEGEFRFELVPSHPVLGNWFSLCLTDIPIRLTSASGAVAELVDPLQDLVDPHGTAPTKS